MFERARLQSCRKYLEKDEGFSPGGTALQKQVRHQLFFVALPEQRNELSRQKYPSGAKARSFRNILGTTKVVPFQNNKSAHKQRRGSRSHRVFGLELS
jgi:hypothetical protein